ncbi:MAG: VWA domain-containing protein [Cellvibrio sp.]
MFEFAYWWVLLLLPLPLLMRRLAPLDKQQVGIRVPFFNEYKSQQNSGNGPLKNNILKRLLIWTIWVLSLVALATPQWIGKPVELPSSGRDLLLAVDISGSMREADMIYNMHRITRLSAVKYVVGNFVEQRKHDRLGLVLFGSQAFLQAPLTHDVKTVQSLLYEAQVGFAGEQTAIGDAIALSIKRLREHSGNQRVIILLTDGENTAGTLSIDTAMDLAEKSKTRIYPIGFSPYDRDVDNQSLQALADRTGGKYFRARSTEDLIEVHRQLDLLEPIEQTAQTYRPIKNLFYWPLGAALLLAMILLSPLTRSGTQATTKLGRSSSFQSSASGDIK